MCVPGPCFSCWIQVLCACYFHVSVKMLKRVGKIKVIAPQSLDAGTYVLAGETSLRARWGGWFSWSGGGVYCWLTGDGNGSRKRRRANGMDLGGNFGDWWVGIGLDWETRVDKCGLSAKFTFCNLMLEDQILFGLELYGYCTLQEASEC